MAIRRSAYVAVLFLLAQAVAPFTPASVLLRLRAAVPVRFYATPLPAALVLEADGRHVVHLSSSLAALGSADAFAFSYLHEAGHLALGHLLLPAARSAGPAASLFPERDRSLLWTREFDADRWAAVHAARAGYDPRAGFALLAARFGGHSSGSHPSPRERLLRLDWALMEDGRL